MSTSTKRPVPPPSSSTNPGPANNHLSLPPPPLKRAKEDELEKRKSTTPVFFKSREEIAAERMENEMRDMLGFASFESTKGKEVKDNVLGPAKGGKVASQTRKYRQYLNKTKKPRGHGGAGDGEGGGGGGGTSSSSGPPPSNR